MYNAIRNVWAGNGTPNNPYHGYVEMLTESKCWKHKGCLKYIFTFFITFFHVATY